MMKEKMKRNLLMCLALTIAMTSLAACNTNEDDVVVVPSTSTPVATATADAGNPTTDAPGTTATTADASATPDVDATVAPSDNPITTDGQDGEPGVENTPTQGATEGTATAEPSATGNAAVKPTATVKPSATKAPTKKPTATPKKTPTPTKKPTATKTPAKTATPKPTATAQKEVYQTIEFEGKTYKVLMGRNGNPKLIKDYSTLPKILQVYAHPTFDKEAIIRDIYTYAKTLGFTYFGYAQDVMTEELAWECSWYSPSIVSYLGDSAYNDWEPTELDDIIARREGGFSMVDFLAMQNIDTLCLWVRDYGDSSNRKDYWDNGFYNGKVTKEYALYFMYGWPSEVPYYKW